MYLFMAALGLRCCKRAFSPCGYSSLQRAGFSLWRLLLLWARALGCTDFSSHGTEAQQPWCMSLVTPQHAGVPRSGLEPVSPALAGAPPLSHHGSPILQFFSIIFFKKRKVCDFLTFPIGYNSSRN